MWQLISIRDSFCFTARTNWVLRQAGIETVGDLLDYTWQEFLALKNAKMSTLYEIREVVWPFCWGVLN